MVQSIAIVGNDAIEMMMVADVQQPLMFFVYGSKDARQLQEDGRNKTIAMAAVGDIITIEKGGFDARKRFINKIYLPLIACKHYLVPGCLKVPDDRHTTAGMAETPIEGSHKDIFMFLAGQ